MFPKFSTVLTIFGADKNGWRQPRNFGCPLCFFCLHFVFIGQWEWALTNTTFLLGIFRTIKSLFKKHLNFTCWNSYGHEEKVIILQVAYDEIFIVTIY